MNRPGELGAVACAAEHPRGAATARALLVALTLGALVAPPPGAAQGSAARHPLAAPATALLERGDFAAAEPLLRQLVAADPGVPLYKYFLGFCLLNRNQYREAETYLRAATEAAPREHHWLQVLAKDLLEQGRHADAAKVLDQAIALRPDPEYRYARAVCLINAGRPKEAEADLRACLELLPAHAQALYELGRILADRGADAESVPLFRRCLAAEPGHVECRFRLGLGETRVGDPRAAVPLFEAVVQQVPGHVGALLNLGQTLARLGRRDEAKKWLQRFTAASALQEEIEFQQASVALEVADPDRRLNLARLLLQVGRLEDAMKEIRAALALAPARPECHRLLGVALRRLGRDEEAAAAEARAREVGGPAR